MTASETAARKKELSENFTIEELADMYLASERRCEDVLEEAKKRDIELGAMLCSRDTELARLKAECDRMSEERNVAVNSLRSCEGHLEDMTKRFCAAREMTKRLKTALDVIIGNYASLKGLVEVREN